MFTNLAEQYRLHTAPPPAAPEEPHLIEHFYPDFQDRMTFVQVFSYQPNPKAWLENMGVGEAYSTNVADADFLALYAADWCSDPMVRRSPAGEKFFELMGDLCDLARRAGNF